MDCECLFVGRSMFILCRSFPGKTACLNTWLSSRSIALYLPFYMTLALTMRTQRTCTLCTVYTTLRTHKYGAVWQAVAIAHQPTNWISVDTWNKIIRWFAKTWDLPLREICLSESTEYNHGKNWSEPPKIAALINESKTTYSWDYCQHNIRQWGRRESVFFTSHHVISDSSQRFTNDPSPFLSRAGQSRNFLQSTTSLQCCRILSDDPRTLLCILKPIQSLTHSPNKDTRIVD